MGLGLGLHPGTRPRFYRSRSSADSSPRMKGSPPPASPRQPCSTHPCPAEANPSPSAGGGLGCSGASGGRLTKRGTFTAPRLTTVIPRRVRVGRWRWRELSTRGPRLQKPQLVGGRPLAPSTGCSLAQRPCTTDVRPFCSRQPALG
jgi:hypothetical protein